MIDEFAEFEDEETLNESNVSDRTLRVGIPKYEELPIYEGETPYYEIEALSWSTLSRFISNPLYFKRNPGWKRESSGFELGDYIHKMLLERDKYESLFKRANVPLNPDGEPLKYGKRYQAALQAIRDEGYLPYTDAMKETFEEIQTSLEESNYGTFIKTKYAEVPLIGTLNGVKCKGKVDAYDEEFGIIDLKTSSDNLFQLDGFSKYNYQCSNFGYYFELVFYGSLIESTTGLFPPLKLLAMQTKVPYQVCVFEISKRTVDFCRTKLFEEMLPLWKEYQEDNLDCGRKILTL